MTETRTAEVQNPRYIRPGIVVDGETVYPSNLEYLIAFAIRGFKWAEVMLADYVAREVERWAGDGI